MRIIVDAFGGDNAPLAILQGSEAAQNEYSCNITLCGDEDKIRDCAKINGIDISNMDILHAPTVIPVEANPRKLQKDYRNSSLAVGLQALADGKGDAFVSAGSTAAVVVGSNFFVKRIKGVKNVALATLLPSNNGPYMLLDCGAKIDCSSETLYSFGLMGDLYMRKVRGVENPRIGLANIGTEPNKGTRTQVKAYKIMEKAPYNFVGNVEVRDIPSGTVADVIVCDGYTGNIFLKTYEGTALMLLDNIKHVYLKNSLTKLSVLPVKNGFKELKETLDFNEYGGAPLMGIRKPVIKAHGSSEAKTFKNAIRQAIEYAGSGVIETIEESVSEKKKREMDRKDDENV